MSDADRGNLMRKFQDHIQRGSGLTPVAVQSPMMVEKRLVEWCNEGDKLASAFRSRFPSGEVSSSNKSYAVPAQTAHNPVGGHPSKPAKVMKDKTNKPTKPPPMSTLPMCSTCGKTHKDACSLSAHPDANKNPAVKWIDTPAGKGWQSLGKTSLGIGQRYSFTEKILVPLDAALAQSLRDGLPIRPPSTNTAGTQPILIHNIQTIGSTPSTHVAASYELPRCCRGDEAVATVQTPIPAIIGQSTYLINVPITALIDTGCLQTNVVSSRVADILISKGKANIQNASRALRSGVGGGTYGVNSLIEFDIEFSNSKDTSRKPVRIYIRALISRDIEYDLIIGLPTIQHFHLLATLSSHFNSLPTLCEVCSDASNTLPDPTRQLLLNSIAALCDPPPHSTSHASNDELAEVLERLHLSEIFDIEADDDELEDGDDITDILRQGAEGDLKVDVQGSSWMQKQLLNLVTEFADIFSTSVKGMSASVTPLDFSYNRDAWERTANRLPSRTLSPEKQNALHGMIEELLDLGVIRPSKATSWSQVHLVRKPAPSN
jgi:hypothetical protein